MKQGSRGAFDKAVRTWPPGFAADAGGYVNSIVGRNGVKVCRGCARSPGDERHGLKRGLLGESAAESGIEETGRKNLSGLKAERCGVRRSTRSFRIGEICFMLPRWSGVESEVGFARR